MQIYVTNVKFVIIVKNVKNVIINMNFVNNVKFVEIVHAIHVDIVWIVMKIQFYIKINLNGCVVWILN